MRIPGFAAIRPFPHCFQAPQVPLRLRGRAPASWHSAIPATRMQIPRFTLPVLRSRYERISQQRLDSLLVAIIHRGRSGAGQFSTATGHFRTGSRVLIALEGESACGSLADRALVLDLLRQLPAAMVAEPDEALSYVERTSSTARGSDTSMFTCWPPQRSEGQNSGRATKGCVPPRKSSVIPSRRQAPFDASGDATPTARATARSGRRSSCSPASCTAVERGRPSW